MISKSLAKLMIVTQIFTLMAVLAMPFLIKILPGVGGKILFVLLAILSVGLAVLLRRSLSGFDGLK